MTACQSEGTSISFVEWGDGDAAAGGGCPRLRTCPGAGGVEGLPRSAGRGALARVVVR